jgi:hypothetical protein
MSTIFLSALLMGWSLTHRSDRGATFKPFLSRGGGGMNLGSLQTTDKNQELYLEKNILCSGNGLCFEHNLECAGRSEHRQNLG